MSHWDKREEKWVKSVYPKIGGRLRLAHEDNEQLSIASEIVKYDENIAVVKAVSTSMKGSFSWIWNGKCGEGQYHCTCYPGIG